MKEIKKLKLIFKPTFIIDAKLDVGVTLSVELLTPDVFCVV
jgi:hypothetical protein